MNKVLPIKQVHLDNILLDLVNYRIPTAMKNEVAALQFLFTEEDVLTQAKEILRDGYFDIEIPLALEETKSNNKTFYTVLEGNRRISALKALHNPTLVPAFTSQLNQLLKKYSEEAAQLPKSIRVMVIPNRQVAAPRLARLHIGSPKRRWSVDQQANFFYSQLSSTVSVEALKATYPSENIIKFIRMGSFRRFISAVKYEDSTLSQYAKSSDLKMSALEYAYRIPEIASAIGVDFAKDGRLQPTDKTPEKIAKSITASQRKALEFLLNEFRSGRLNTRSQALRVQNANTNTARQELIAQLSSTSPSGGGAQGNGQSINHPAAISAPSPNASNSGSNSIPQTPTTPSLPNHASTLRALQLNEVNIRILHTNLQNKYQEIRKLSVTETPISIVSLMRSVLETTVKWYLLSVNQNTNAQGSLADVFRNISSSLQVTHPNIGRSIQRIQSGSIEQPGSIKWFNNVMHSVEGLATETEVHEAWNHVRPVLREIINSANASNP